jgi:TonB family protein
MVCTCRLRQETRGYVGLGGLRHHFLWIEPSLWVALTVSLAVHSTALFLLASHRAPRRIGPIAIALYRGAGDGRVLGAGDGRSAGGTGERGGTDEEVRGEVPPEPVVPEPAAPEGTRRESRTRVKSERAAARGSDVSLRALGRRGEGAGADASGGARSVVQQNTVESPQGGSAAVASRGGIGAGQGSAGEGGVEGAERGGGTGGGGSDLEASCLACPVPSYPRRARRRGWEGVVDLRLGLDPAGRVSEVGVARSSGFRVLDDAAMAAARRSRFHLRSRRGTSGPVWGRMRYRFEIGGG